MTPGRAAAGSPLRLGPAETEEAPWGELTGWGRPGGAEWREAPSRPRDPQDPSLPLQTPRPPSGATAACRTPTGPRCPRPTPSPSLGNPSPEEPPRPPGSAPAPSDTPGPRDPVGVAGQLLPLHFSGSSSPETLPDFRPAPPQTPRPPEAVPPIQGPGTPKILSSRNLPRFLQDPRDCP